MALPDPRRLYNARADPRGQPSYLPSDPQPQPILLSAESLGALPWVHMITGGAACWCLSLRTLLALSVPWQIEPLSGPLDGGTLLTIRGRNLGRRLSDVTHGVWIGTVACEPLADRYTVSEE